MTRKPIVMHTLRYQVIYIKSLSMERKPAGDDIL